MNPSSGLSPHQPIGFVPTTDMNAAGAFYRDTLGLALMHETPFALVFDAAGVMLRVTHVEQHTPGANTVLGWRVSGIQNVVRDLVARGVRFEQFDGMEQDELRIWTSPDRARIAWFKDPDGNVLSLTEFPTNGAR